MDMGGSVNPLQPPFLASTLLKGDFMSSRIFLFPSLFVLLALGAILPATASAQIWIDGTTYENHQYVNDAIIMSGRLNN